MVTHPTILALEQFEEGRRVVVRWPDGQEIMFMPHNYFPPDENPDEVESYVGGVVDVLAPGPRLTEPHGLYEIRADDPPSVVMSPDRKRVWTEVGPTVTAIHLRDDIADVEVRMPDGTTRAYQLQCLTGDLLGAVEPLTPGFQRDLWDWEPFARELCQRVRRMFESARRPE